MNPKEPRRPQLLLQLGDRPVDRIGLAVRGREDHPTLRKEVRDSADLQKPGALSHSDGNALHWRAPRQRLQHAAKNDLAAGALKLLQLIQGTVQFLRLDGLQQVIDRVHRERFQRILIVSGREYNERLSLDPRQQIESGEPGHLNIQEQYVGRCHSNRLDRRRGIHFGAYDFHPPGRLKQARQPFQRGQLVVNQIGSKHGGHRRGTQNETVGPLRISSLAPGPSIVTSRCCKLASPCPGRIACWVNPGPSSDTSTNTEPTRSNAATRISAPSNREPTACFTLFSTSVCSDSAGTCTGPSSGGTSMRKRRRSP